MGGATPQEARTSPFDTNAPFSGLLENPVCVIRRLEPSGEGGFAALEWVKAIPLKGKPHKGNPPYPPLSGGQETAKPPLPGGAHPPDEGGRIAFLYPPDKGGRGGWFSRRGEDERGGFFNSPFSVAFYLRRLLRVRKEALAVCVGRRQDFFNSLKNGCVLARLQTLRELKPSAMITAVETLIVDISPANLKG